MSFRDFQEQMAAGNYPATPEGYAEYKKDEAERQATEDQEAAARDPKAAAKAGLQELHQAARQGDDITKNPYFGLGCSTIVGLACLAAAPEDGGATLYPAGISFANAANALRTIWLGSTAVSAAASVPKYFWSAADQQAKDAAFQAEKARLERSYENKMKAYVNDREEWLAQLESQGVGDCCKLTLDGKPTVTIDGQPAAYLGNPTDCDQGKHGELFTGNKNVFMGLRGVELVPLATRISLERQMQESPTNVSPTTAYGGGEVNKGWVRREVESIDDLARLLRNLAGTGLVAAGIPAGGPSGLVTSLAGIGLFSQMKPASEAVFGGAGRAFDSLLGTNKAPGPGLTEGLLDDVGDTATIFGMKALMRLAKPTINPSPTWEGNKGSPNAPEPVAKLEPTLEEASSRNAPCPSCAGASPPTASQILAEPPPKMALWPPPEPGEAGLRWRVPVPTEPEQANLTPEQQAAVQNFFTHFKGDVFSARRLRSVIEEYPPRTPEATAFVNALADDKVNVHVMEISSKTGGYFVPPYEEGERPTVVLNNRGFTGTTQANAKTLYHEGAGHWFRYTKMGDLLYPDYMKEYESNWPAHEVEAEVEGRRALTGEPITPSLVSAVKNDWLPGKYLNLAKDFPASPDYLKSPDIWGESCSTCRSPPQDSMRLDGGVSELPPPEQTK
jgi:hypothetical protein